MSAPTCDSAAALVADDEAPARLDGAPGRNRPLEALAGWMTTRVPSDGHVSERAPDLCLYRYSQPNSYRKAAAFGVTPGVVLQGEKLLRIANRELVIDPTRMLVITRESEHLAAARSPGSDRPYLSLGLCFAPEQVARALLALSEAGAASDDAAEIPAFVMPSDPVILGALQRLVGTLDDPLDRKVLAPGRCFTACCAPPPRRPCGPGSRAATTPCASSNPCATSASATPRSSRSRAWPARPP